MKIDDEFVASLRSEPVGDDDLKASLLSAGWDENLPAIRDEHGTLLVGNRRMAIAKANGIKPVEVVVTFGEGPEAEAARARLAVVSNTGSAGITPTDRKRVAERLYKDGMTQAAIGAVMGVSQPTVQRDLEGLFIVNKPPRPQGGRPKGSGTKTSAKPNTPVAPKPTVKSAEAIVVASLHAQGLTVPEIVEQTGVSKHTARRIVENDRTEKDAYERGFAEGAAQATLDPQKLFNSVEKQVEQRVNKLARDLYANFDSDVDNAVKNKLNIRRKEIEDMEAKANRIINSRRGVLTDKEYRSIWSLLHGDMNASEMKLVDAYSLWQEKRGYLVLDATPVPVRAAPNFSDATMQLHSTRLAEVLAKNNARRAEQAVRQVLEQENGQASQPAE